MWIYIAPSRETFQALRHGSQFYPQTTPCLPPPRKRSPDHSTTDCGHRHLIAAYYSFIDPERMKVRVGLEVKYNWALEWLRLCISASAVP